MALQGHHRQHFDRHTGWDLWAKLRRTARSWKPTTSARYCHSTESFWQSAKDLPLAGDAGMVQQMYRGIFEFAGEIVKSSPDQLFDFAHAGVGWSNALLSLDWLKDFAAHPRRLTAAYAVSLLQAWNDLGLMPQDVTYEAHRLLNMQTCFPLLAGMVEAPQRNILMMSWEIQRERLKLAKASDAIDAAHQALALAMAALAMQNPGEQMAESLRRLEAALIKTTHADGGPITCSMTIHLQLAYNLMRLNNLMAERHFTLSANLSQQFDKMIAFVAMFQRSDNCLAFGLEKLHGNRLVLPFGNEIQKVASNSGVTRLCHGRSVLIASNGTSFPEPCVDISVGKMPLLTFGPFGGQAAAKQSSLQEDSIGSVLSLPKRQIFVAASGHDIRVQEELSAKTSSAQLILKFDCNIKISLARHFTSASLALPDRSHWQVSLRGGHFEMGRDDNELILIANPTGRDCLNWAVKRVGDEKSDRGQASGKKTGQPTDLLI